MNIRQNVKWSCRCVFKQDKSTKCPERPQFATTLTACAMYRVTTRKHYASDNLHCRILNFSKEKYKCFSPFWYRTWIWTWWRAETEIRKQPPGRSWQCVLRLALACGGATWHSRTHRTLVVVSNTPSQCRQSPLSWCLLCLTSHESVSHLPMPFHFVVRGKLNFQTKAEVRCYFAIGHSDMVSGKA